MSNQDMVKVQEDLQEAAHMRMTRLNDSLFSKDLAPHYMKLAERLCTSELVPKSFRGKPQDLFLCWAFGYSIGMSPEQSMQCIAIINGRACMYGDEMLALCMAHKDFEDIIEEPMLWEGNIVGYTCTVKRKGRVDKLSSFTLDMAKKAGLLAKGGPWVQYTERMLKLRARGFCLRDAFPDALKGIRPREEVEDYIEGEYKVVESTGSRTELLKKDYLNKKEMNNDERLYGSCAPAMDSISLEENENHEECAEEDGPGTSTPEMHSKIKQLITAKGFTEERLAKALAYYEVDSIEALDTEQTNHFMMQLIKL